ncbi:MAG: endonuclease VIII, partial [Bacteroidales bacterium]
MIELPESIIIGKQVNEILTGRTVTGVIPPTHLHKFTFFNDTPAMYQELLVGKRVGYAEGKGIFVDIEFNEDVHLSIFDGINMK